MKAVPWSMPHSLQAARQSKTLLLPMVQLPRIPSPTVACYSLYCWGVALQSLASFCSHRHNPFDDLLRLRSPGLRPPGDVSIRRRMPYQYSRITEVLGPSTERLNPSLSGGRAMNLHTGSHLLPVVRRTLCFYTWNPGSQASATQSWTPGSISDSAAHSHLQGRVKDPQQRS